jgi:hypothetical protein
MADLLLHSLKEFDEVVFEIVERTRPKSLLESGAETGAFTERLLGYCEATGGKLVSIDPAPHPALLEKAMVSESIELVVGFSVPHLTEFGTDADLALIDGDHNYFTVSRELELIHAAWVERDKRGLVLLHDVGFPCAERDMYYSPERIPSEARHPHSFQLGVTLDSPALVSSGLRGEGAFAWALASGGEKNGVLTAVRDFTRAHPEYRYRSIDAVFGLGALTIADGDQDRIVGEVFARYDNALVRRLERNRLELYLKVLELQDALNARVTP